MADTRRTSKARATLKLRENHFNDLLEECTAKGIVIPDWKKWDRTKYGAKAICLLILKLEYSASKTGNPSNCIVEKGETGGLFGITKFTVSPEFQVLLDESFIHSTTNLQSDQIQAKKTGKQAWGTSGFVEKRNLDGSTTFNYGQEVRKHHNDQQRKKQKPASASASYYVPSYMTMLCPPLHSSVLASAQCSMVDAGCQTLDA